MASEPSVHRVPSSLPCLSVVFGNSNGLAVVDYLQKALLLHMATSELYSPADPYQRQPRSPRKVRQPSGGELHAQRLCVCVSMLSCWPLSIADEHD